MMASPAPTQAPEALLAWMGGLADPTRLRLLRVLEREELSVGELCDVLRLPQSTVSRHLKTLADQGWVESRREGTASFYRIAEALDAGAKRLWRFARGETDAWAAVQQDAVRLETRLAERRTEAQRFFAGAAGEWDRVRAEAYGAEFERAILRALPLPEWTIADLGCGTGSFTLELARSGARVIGVDQSASMLKLARSALRDFANAELRQASLEALPLPDASCDVATLVLVLSYVERVEPVLAEARRILGPGGRLFVVDAWAHQDEQFRRRLGQVRPGIDPRWLEGWLVDAGFERVGAGGPVNLRGRTDRSGPDLFLASGTLPRAKPPQR
jgi:ubiquinone/menaquinone biosynthesis C-methylase UbiE/DNA-binding transcriptional ArsR family regulator